jgi:hypothetical protein
MNTHSDGLYGLHLEHFMKVKDFGIIGVSYGSCGPTSSGGGWKVSGQDVIVSKV